MSNKQYGLILKKKDAPAPRLQRANVFGDADEDDSNEKVSFYLFPLFIFRSTCHTRRIRHLL